MDGVHLTAVQVIPGAVGGAGGAHVDVAVLSDRKCYVGICSVAAGPADRAKVVLAAGKTLHVLGDAGTRFQLFREADCALTSIVLSSDGEGEQLSTGQIQLHHRLVGLK